MEVGVAPPPSPLASALVKNSIPCWVWKWYFTQNFLPAAFTHIYVCVP